MKLIASEAYSDIPGDSRRVMTTDHTDANGSRWPKGTIFQPLSAGRNNLYGRHEEKVSIAGERVVFAGK